MEIFRRQTEVTPKVRPFTCKHRPRTTPVFVSPAINPNIGDGHLLPPPPPNEEEETIHHRSSTYYHRQDQRRPHVPKFDEFQEFATNRLNDLHEGMTRMGRLSVKRKHYWNDRFNAFEAISQQRHEECIGGMVSTKCGINKVKLVGRDATNGKRSSKSIGIKKGAKSMCNKRSSRKCNKGSIKTERSVNPWATTSPKWCTCFKTCNPVSFLY